MIESLPDVSHLRYRGERVEWREYRPGAEYHLALPGSCAYHYLASVYGGYGLWYGAVYVSADSVEYLGVTIRGVNAVDVAKEVILRLLANDVVTEIDMPAGFFTIPAELYALVAAVAQRRSQSTADFLTRIIESKTIALAVVDYRDDPEIRRLHIALAESWGKE